MQKSLLFLTIASIFIGIWQFLESLYTDGLSVYFVDCAIVLIANC